MKLYSIAQIKLFEKLAMDKMSLSEDDLMFRAGSSALKIVSEQRLKAKNIAVFCGAGNNAGDGYIYAACVKDAGFNATCFYLKDPEESTGAAKNAYTKAKKSAVNFIAFDPSEDLSTYDYIVDALLGTGIKGELRPEFRNAIQTINDTGKPVVALDLPSGLNADTGIVADIAVKADYTITFVAQKRGLYTADAFDVCGKVFLSDLGIDAVLIDSEMAAAEVLDLPSLKAKLLPKRKRNSHKGSFGHVLLIGGNHGMGGAIRMAGEAAARVGAGLTSILTQENNINPIISARPELMPHAFSDKNFHALQEQAIVIAIGPGLGRDQWAQKCFDAAICIDKPKVIDADGLWFLAKSESYSTQWVLTPHPKEAANLLGITTEEIQADRFAAVKALQKRYGGVIILKGAGTLICDGSSTIKISTYGNPGMSSGGMGDVLTGIVAGLIAQGLGLADAAMLGVCLHGDAADNVAEKYGERGMLALDLMDELHQN